MYSVSIKGVLRAPGGEVVLLMNERGEWELPGGRIEPGETPAECLVREIKEELDLDVTVGALIDTYLFEVIPGKHVFIVTYHSALAGTFNPSISDEHSRLGLFRPDALPDNLPRGYRQSVNAATR